jgi:hypothetical protein
LALVAIARGTGLSRRRGTLGVVGVEHMRGTRERVGAERGLLQDHLISDLVEGQERCATCDEGSEMIVPLVQPFKDIEDEVTVEDHVTEVIEGVSHALHLAKVFAHQEVTLDEVVKCGIEMKCVHLIVADELVLERELDLARDDVSLLADVLKLTNDRAEDLGDDDVLHALPCRAIDRTASK